MLHLQKISELIPFGHNLRKHFTLSNLLLLILLAAGIVEGVWGILQMFGLAAAGNTRFHVTGSFYNPGPFGCFLGTIFPLAIHTYFASKCKTFRVIAFIYVIFTAFLLPGGMSRTGWICAIVGSLVSLSGIYMPKLRSFSRKKQLSISAAALTIIIAAGIGAYYLKQDSADGRALMRHIATEAALKAPITGVGWENVAGTYGNEQEAFFSNGNATPKQEMIAGVPAFVFNEYLQIAIAFGIPCAIFFTFLLFSALFIYIKNRKFEFAGIIAAIAICCMFSYPFQFIEFKLLTCICIIYAFTLLNNKAIKFSSVAIVLFTSLLFITHTPQCRIDIEFRIAQNTRDLKQYRKSNEQLFALLPRTADPMPLNIIGRNYQDLGRRDSAEYFFNRASQRVPNRLYPHYLLMKLYAENSNDSLLMQREANILLTKQPKTHSTAVDEMREEARQLLHIAAQ